MCFHYCLYIETNTDFSFVTGKLLEDTRIIYVKLMNSRMVTDPDNFNVILYCFKLAENFKIL